MPHELIQISGLIAIAFLVTLLLFSRAILVVHKSRKRRKQAEAYGVQISKGNVAGIMAAFDFPVTTIETDKSIDTVRTLFMAAGDVFDNMMGIENISACHQQYFLLAGNFSGSESFNKRKPLYPDMVPEEYNNPVYEKLFPANILFRKDEEHATITLLMDSMPENNDHDNYIKDFTKRLKAILS